VETVHIPFDDPVDAEGADEEKMRVFRRVRDELRDRLVEAVRKRG
jgi:arsenate reductase